MKKMKTLLYVLLALLFVSSCKMDPPVEPVEEDNFKFTISNNLGYSISAVYAGIFRDINDTDEYSSTGPINSNSENEELNPPASEIFHIWYKYYDAVDNINWTVRLTESNGDLSEFVVTQDKQYFLDFFINEDTGEPQYRFSIIGTEGLPQVETPIIINTSNIVSITTETPGADIIYTTDGSTPGITNGNPYSAAFSITQTTTVCAMAFLEDYQDSSISTEIFTIDDLTDDAPLITAFSIDNETETTIIAVNTFTASDDFGIAGYYISIDDSTAPNIDDPAWMVSAPTTITLPDTYGIYTVYAWVKDTGGNISSSSSQTTEYNISIFSTYETVVDTTGQPDFDSVNFINHYSVGDLNGDNLLDIAFTPPYSENLYVAYQAVNHTFSSIEKYIIAKPVAHNSGPNHIEIGDLNHDNRNDIVISSEGAGSGESDNYVGIYYQKSDNTMDNMFLISANSDFRVRIGDVNNDGLNDLVGVSVQGQTIDVYIQNPDGTLATPVYYPSLVNIRGDMWLGDISGDSRNDIIAVDGQYTDDSIHIFIQETDGSLQAEKTIDLVDFPFYDSFEDATGFYLANFDTDPALELCITAGWTEVDSKVMVFDYSSTNILDNKSAEYYTHGAKNVFASDVNGDGKTDIVYINGYSNDLETLINNGDNTFTLTKSAEPIWNADTPTIIDLNNDSYADVLLNSGTEAGITVFWGTSH